MLHARPSHLVLFLIHSLYPLPSTFSTYRCSAPWPNATASSPLLLVLLLLGVASPSPMRAPPRPVAGLSPWPPLLPAPMCPLPLSPRVPAPRWPLEPPLGCSDILAVFACLLWCCVLLRKLLLLLLLALVVGPLLLVLLLLGFADNCWSCAFAAAAAGSGEVFGIESSKIGCCCFGASIRNVGDAHNLRNRTLPTKARTRSRSHCGITIS